MVYWTSLKLKDYNKSMINANFIDQLIYLALKLERFNISKWKKEFLEYESNRKSVNNPYSAGLIKESMYISKKNGKYDLSDYRIEWLSKEIVDFCKLKTDWFSDHIFNIRNDNDDLNSAKCYFNELCALYPEFNQFEVRLNYEY